MPSLLTPLGFSPGEAIASILAFQAVTYVVVLSWGPLGLWRLTGSVHPLPREEMQREL